MERAKLTPAPPIVRNYVPLTAPLEARSGARGAKPGSHNRVTNVLKDAILYAAERCGEDGNGRGKLVGYLTRIAKRYPKEFTTLLARVLPLQLNATSTVTVDHRYRTTEEVKAELRSRGILLEGIYTVEDSPQP